MFVQKCTTLLNLERMLQNVCLPAEIGLDTAANEPRQACCMIRAREPCVGIVSVPGRCTLPPPPKPHRAYAALQSAKPRRNFDPRSPPGEVLTAPRTPSTSAGRTPKSSTPRSARPTAASQQTFRRQENWKIHSPLQPHAKSLQKSADDF